MEKTMEPLSAEYSDEDLVALIHWHTVDIAVGLVGTMLCICTVFVFFSSKKFFRANKLLALLAIGDLSSCLGIMAMGFIRKNMYMAAMETGRVPIESTWSCAVKPFVWLRLLGSLIPPGIVFWISVERFLAVFAPMIYRNHVAKHAGIPPLVIVIYTVLATIIAYTIAWVGRNWKPANFYCGRKVSFTVYYSSYVYCADVAGFLIALILNFLTLCKLANLYAKRKNRFEVRRQLKRIRYMIVISLVSAVFVALPNGISMMAAWIGRIDMYFVEPAVWMIAFKSSINVFVYLLLKTEFRQRVYELLGCLNIEDRKRERVFDVSMFRSSTATPHQRAIIGGGVAARPVTTATAAAVAPASDIDANGNGVVYSTHTVPTTLVTSYSSESTGRKSAEKSPAASAMATLTRVITRQKNNNKTNNNNDTNNNNLHDVRFLSPNVCA